jgi:hypothetical protein
MNLEINIFILHSQLSITQLRVVWISPRKTLHFLSLSLCLSLQFDGCTCSRNTQTAFVSVLCTMYMKLTHDGEVMSIFVRNYISSWNHSTNLGEIRY